MNHAIELLRQALLAPGDESALERVRQNAKAIGAALDDADQVLSPEEVGQAAAHADWVAQVYGALGAGDGEQDLDNDMAAALVRLRNDEVQEIADAFETLVENLGPFFMDWEQWFGEVRPAQQEIEHLLADEELGGALGPHGTELLSFGLTPLMFQAAARGLQLLFDRTRRAAAGADHRRQVPRWLHGPVSEDESVAIMSAAGTDLRIPHDVLLAQVRGTRDLPAGAAAPLLEWLSQVWKERPYLIGGYEFDLEGKRFVAAAPGAQRDGEEIMWRWSQSMDSVRYVAG